MFGLTGPQGNHGEDVKEYWWYLDGTPTHSWNTWRYHYPQREFPYGDLVAENARRGKLEPEYELVDTGIFDDEPLLGRHCRLRQGRAAGPADADHGGERRPGRGHPRCAADAVVPQHLVVGIRRPPEADAAAGRQPDRRQPLAIRAPGAGRRRRPGAAVLRERDQRRAAVRRARTSRRTRRTASTTTCCTAPTTVNPLQRGHQGRPALPGDRAGRRIHHRSRCGWSGCRTRRSTSTRWRRASQPIDLGTGYDTVVAARKKRGRRVLRRR